MTVRYEPFSKSDIERIDAATIRVLERTGVRVLEPEAVKLLEGAGASFDRKTSVVKIPERVLKDCISGAPSKFKLHSRDGKHVLAFGEGNVYHSSVGTPVNAEGLDGVVRPSTAKDVENFYKLTDSLPNIDHSSWACWPRDVNEDVAHLWEVYLAFKHSNKTTDGYNWGRDRTEDLLDLAGIAAGGRDDLAKKPQILGFVNPVSPLTMSKELTEGLISFARAGQPCCYPPECMAGGTSPATIAGLLVQQNAEILPCIALSQLAKRQAPVFYASVSGMMDMRSGSIVLGSAEIGLIMAGAAQLARHYKIPIRGTGGNTESMVVDYQAGIESMSTLLMASLAGIDFIYDSAGSIESSLTASYAKMVLDDDMCGMVKRILAGADTSEESLATEVIESTGLKGGYLSSPHTLKHYKSEAFIGQNFWRGARTSWANYKQKDIVAKARKRAEQLINEHVMRTPLDSETDRKMMEFIKKVEKRGYPR